MLPITSSILLFAYSWQSCSDSELQLKKERGNQPSGSKSQSLKASKFKAKTPDDSHRLVGPLSNEWLAFACPPWGVVSSVAVCLSNLASCYSPHLFQRLSKRAAGASPVHFRVEWLHKPIFSRPTQTLETAGTLLIAFVAQTSVVEHRFTPKDKKCCYNHTLRVVRALCLVAAALALSSDSRRES